MHSANDGKSLDRSKWKIPILHFFFFFLMKKNVCVCGCFILMKLQVVVSYWGARSLWKSGRSSATWRRGGDAMDGST